MSQIGSTEIVVLAVLAVILSVGPPIWALRDMARYTPEQWQRAQQSQSFWRAVLVISAVVVCIGMIGMGLVATVLYRLLARPALQRVAQGVLPPHE